MGFSRQEYWSGWLCPPPGALLDQGIKPMSLTSTCIGSSLPLAPSGKPSSELDRLLLIAIQQAAPFLVMAACKGI